MSSPPSLNPLPSLLVVEPPFETAPLLNEMQFSMVTGLIGPVSVLVKRSQPSSTLWCAMQPLKTLPGPVVSLQANPSASSPLSGSKLSKESQLRIRLLAGHSLCGALDEWRPSCSPESRLLCVEQRSMVLLFPPMKRPLSPAPIISNPRKCQKKPLS